VPFDIASLKGVAAGAGAVAVGLLVNRWLEFPFDLIVGIPALGVTYLGLLLALGISSEDRLVFGMLIRRIHPARAGPASATGSHSTAAD
jgi:hypothetical protein